MRGPVAVDAYVTVLVFEVVDPDLDGGEAALAGAAGGAQGPRSAGRSSRLGRCCPGVNERLSSGTRAGERHGRLAAVWSRLASWLRAWAGPRTWETRMAGSAERAELFCGGRCGAWRVQECVLSKPD